MNFPKLLIIGAPRSGTSTLFHMLCQTPKIWGNVKETHFFNQHFSNGLRYYADQFKDAPEGAMTIEATPFYLGAPGVAERVKDALPDVKLIVLLRNPVTRCISHYWWNQDKFGDDPEVLIDSSHHCVEYGHYAEHLERWFEHFPRNRILIMASEVFFAAPITYATHTIFFAGQSVHNLKFKRTYYDPLDWRKAKYGLPRISKEVLSWLRLHYESHNKRLVELLSPYKITRHWEKGAQ